jgi:hypothetical protein
LNASSRNSSRLAWLAAGLAAALIPLLAFGQDFLDITVCPLLLDAAEPPLRGAVDWEID